MMYVQCALQRGSAERIAWIPQPHARVGNRVKLKDRCGWQPDWKIEATFGSLPEWIVLELKVAYT